MFRFSYTYFLQPYCHKTLLIYQSVQKKTNASKDIFVLFVTLSSEDFLRSSVSSGRLYSSHTVSY